MTKTYFQRRGTASRLHFIGDSEEEILAEYNMWFNHMATNSEINWVVKGENGFVYITYSSFTKALESICFLRLLDCADKLFNVVEESGGVHSYKRVKGGVLPEARRIATEKLPTYFAPEGFSAPKAKVSDMTYYMGTVEKD